MKLVLEYNDNSCLFAKPANEEEFVAIVEALNRQLQEAKETKRLPKQALHSIELAILLAGRLFIPLLTVEEVR